MSCVDFAARGIIFLLSSQNLHVSHGEIPMSQMAPQSGLWCNAKWKSWNIIAIQVDSGESKTSEDAGALESNSSPADAFRLGRVNFHYVFVVEYMIGAHTLARELASRTPNS
jgi:hypothetical protein